MRAARLSVMPLGRLNMPRIVIVVLLALACISGQSSVQPDLAELDQHVLEAVLAAHAEDDGYFIVSTTPATPSDALANLPRRFASEAVRRLIQRSTSDARLPAAADTRHFSFKDESAVRELFEIPWPDEPVSLDWRWEQFRARFPDARGLISISLPGYARDYRSAVVYVVVSRGALAGTGSFIRLERDHHRAPWRIVETRVVVAA